MTILHQGNLTEESVGEQSARTKRIIAVGIRDNDHDAATLAWATGEARAGIDVLHLVHAYVPMRPVVAAAEGDAQASRLRRTSNSQDWEPAVETAAGDLAGQHVVDLKIAGLPEDVLTEVSAVVQLLVIGDDATNAEESRKITRTIQISGACPVVSVPSGHRRDPAHTVLTLVADERGIPASAFRFGADMATRLGATLQVSRAWDSLHEGELQGPLWLAHQQAQLDNQLAPWRARYPHLAVVARLELGSGWLSRLRSMSRLMITDQASTSVVRTIGAATPELCPTVAVPQTW